MAPALLMDKTFDQLCTVLFIVKTLHAKRSRADKTDRKKTTKILDESVKEFIVNLKNLLKTVIFGSLEAV